MRRCYPTQSWRPAAPTALILIVYLTWLFQQLPLAKTVDDYDALLPWKMPVHLR
jgi:hypothetical protein